MSRRISFFLSLGILLSLRAFGAGLAVEGVDQSRILPPHGAHIEDYRNTGYSLEIRDGEAHVRVDTLPLESRAAFSVPEKVPPTPIGRLARALSVSAETEFEAVSRILAWVARNIEYRLDREQSQDAEEVLARRSGYCTGVARLSVALLESVGIPAREVAGYVMESGRPGERNGFHRWIEVRFSDRGWVFSDPLRSHHYVAATYVRLASDQVQAEAGLEGLLLEREDHIAAVDLYPQAGAGISARRNSDQQLAAALRVLIAEQPQGVAVLVGEKIRKTHALVAGGTTFVGLEPGSYRLRLLLPERVVVERQVDIVDRVRVALFLPAPWELPPAGPRQRDSETE